MYTSFTRQVCSTTPLTHSLNFTGPGLLASGTLRLSGSAALVFFPSMITSDVGCDEFRLLFRAYNSRQMAKYFQAFFPTKHDLESTHFVRKYAPQLLLSVSSTYIKSSHHFLYAFE